MVVMGVNDRDQEAVQAWVERESLPYPIILDPDRSIGISFGMSNAGDERYLSNGSDGRRPGVIIDEQGVILKLLPDLNSVQLQQEVLANL